MMLVGEYFNPAEAAISWKNELQIGLQQKELDVEESLVTWVFR